MQEIKANIVSIAKQEIKFGTVYFEGGIIQKIILESPEKQDFGYLIPGFVDAHVHIESSMLSPVQFARLAVVHGTVGTVSDPHEIGNVLGVKGVEWMIENAQQTPLKICLGAPSCVPATTFETAGATIEPADIKYLFEKYPSVGYLAEVMNFPGVLNKDPDMMAKINIAKILNKPIDGHAPGLVGDLAKQYIEAGPSTDHECFTAFEALEKLKYGMKIIIREGSAAKNFDALIPLAHEHYQKMMFCSDDKHPDNLVEGHINKLVARAVTQGLDKFKALSMACVNPVEHYHLPIGLLAENHPADFVLVDNLQNFEVLATYINGKLVAEKGASLLPNVLSEAINYFEISAKKLEDFEFEVSENQTLKVIECIDGQLITNKINHKILKDTHNFESDLTNDILKIVVVNRYKPSKIAISFIKNIGLKRGAIASSVAHDSHNIVAVGTNDKDLCKAVNLIIEAQGGISAVDTEKYQLLALPIAGLMANADGYEVAKAYTQIDQFAKQNLGSTLNSPFMSLSFMALLVIPHLKLSDLGLFDGTNFELTSSVEG